jgi:hypothetical protein
METRRVPLSALHSRSILIGSPASSHMNWVLAGARDNEDKLYWAVLGGQ